jgi:hypothetical protein
MKNSTITWKKLWRLTAFPKPADEKHNRPAVLREFIWPASMAVDPGSGESSRSPSKVLEENYEALQGSDQGGE